MEKGSEISAGSLRKREGVWERGNWDDGIHGRDDDDAIFWRKSQGQHTFQTSTRTSTALQRFSRY